MRVAFVAAPHKSAASWFVSSSPIRARWPRYPPPALPPTAAQLSSAASHVLGSAYALTQPSNVSVVDHPSGHSLTPSTISPPLIFRLFTAKSPSM